MRLEPGHVKLNRNTGRVRVFQDGAWGTVDEMGWTDDDASVLCSNLLGSNRTGHILTSEEKVNYH